MDIQDFEEILPVYVIFTISSLKNFDDQLCLVLSPKLLT